MQGGEGGLLTCAFACLKEGTAVLWRGTNASLLTAAPMVGMYLPMYDFLVQRMWGMGVLAPVAAGSISRMISMFFVAPLDLLRTRMQVASSMGRVTGRRGMGLVASSRGVVAASRPLTWSGQFDWGQGLAGRTRMLWRGYGAAVSPIIVVKLLFSTFSFLLLVWQNVDPICNGFGGTQHTVRSQ